MKLPNGFGSVHKLPGNRRRPWRARKTVECYIDFDNNIYKQKYITIGYYATQIEALQALADYNANPYNLSVKSITFAEVYDKWSEEHYKTIAPSSCRTCKSAYSYCKPLYDIPMRDIRVSHLEQTIAAADVGDNTKARMKSLFNLMYKYALKHEIVDKDYAALCNNIKAPAPEIVRVPFSDQEIKLLWDKVNFPFADMVLIGIYTGLRPQELAIIKLDDVDLSGETIIGGLKTDAGRNRIIPIHPLILDLIKDNYKKAQDLHSEYLFNDELGQQGTFLTYDKYRRRFTKVMDYLKLEHRPHDTRHTFVTKAKEANMNEYILKLIIGHTINDITEKTYTHRTVEELKKEIRKIK